jgi:hypothetical protein
VHRGSRSPDEEHLHQRHASTTSSHPAWELLICHDERHSAIGRAAVVIVHVDASQRGESNSKMPVTPDEAECTMSRLPLQLMMMVQVNREKTVELARGKGRGCRLASAAQESSSRNAIEMPFQSFARTFATVTCFITQERKSERALVIHVAPSPGSIQSLICRGRVCHGRGRIAAAIGQLDSTKCSRSPLLPNSLSELHDCTTASRFPGTCSLGNDSGRRLAWRDTATSDIHMVFAVPSLQIARAQLMGFGEACPLALSHLPLSGLSDPQHFQVRLNICM